MGGKGKDHHMDIPLIAGVDEVGRGPLAGPVIAAAVILDPKHPIDGLKDSKVLSEKKREYLSEVIQEKAYAWALGSASVEEVDTINVLQAGLLAMKRAIIALDQSLELVKVDGNKAPDVPFEVLTIIGGDNTEPCISAASIIAKVHRDHLMVELDQLFPEYGFAKHKGYGTKEHIHAIKAFGVTKHHRKSFAPCR